MCSAVCCVVRNAKQNQKRKANKIPCQPKQRSVFWRSPVHKAPPGRQKSDREFCLFGGFFLRPACRAMWRAGRSCVACRCCGGFCAWHPGIFLPVCRCLVPGLRAACCFCAWSGLCCRGLLAVCPPCALCVRAFFPYLSPFSASLLPVKILFTCRSGRDGPLLSSEKKVDKDSQKGFAPLNPIPAPCGQSSSLSRC